MATLDAEGLLASSPERARGSDARPDGRSDVLILCLVVAVGALLRLPSLGNSLFGDELSSYFIVTHHSFGGIVRLLDGHSVDLTPPLYFLLSWLVERAGDSVLALRTVSFASGLAAIPLTYLVGLRTVGRRAALVGAAVMALSPFLVFYSTEARAYALVMALVLGSTLCLLKALESQRAGWWVGYALLMGAAMYTHYTSIFVLAAQFLWALALYPKARLRLGIAALGGAALFSPWIPALLRNSRSFGTKVFDVLEPFGASAVTHDTAHWALGHPYLALSEVPGTPGLVLIGVALAAGGLGTALAFRGRRLDVRSPAWLAPVLALATPVGLVLYSVLRVDTWDMRNLISSWPGLALCLGAIVAGHRRLWRIAVPALVLGFLWGAVQLLPADHERPQYDRAADFILAHGGRTDPVAVITAPTPGPLSEMDAALAYAGDPGRPLLRIGAPTLAATLAAPPYALLPAVPIATLAAQAERTGAGQPLFIVAPGVEPVSGLLAGAPVSPRAALGPDFGAGHSGQIFATVFIPLSQFVRAIAHDFAPARTVVYRGILDVSVYEFVRR